MKKLLKTNAAGRRIGDSHPRANLMDDEVDLVLELVESGMSYAQVASKMDVSKSCVAHIAKGRRRSQAAVSVRWVSDGVGVA